jgi:hypothetical protein
MVKAVSEAAYVLRCVSKEVGEWGEVSQEELHKAPADSCVDDLLDALVLAVREVRQGPAGVRQHLLVVGLYQAGQRGQGQLGLQKHPLFGSFSKCRLETKVSSAREVATSSWHEQVGRVTNCTAPLV